MAAPRKDAGILDGNLLLVDRAAKPVNGSAVVVAVNGAYKVKRLAADLIAFGWNLPMRGINPSAWLRVTWQMYL
jgi:hypothetical protein